jgi:hypothetical protein
MAYYIGDGTNQSLYPVVTFGVIEEVKSKIEKVYNVLDNKIDELADNFATDNLIVNNAVIDNAQVNNFDVSTLIASGSSGTDGQYLGKNNGNIEWGTPPFDTNHLYVNHITVNNDATVNGDNFTHKSFDVTSMTVISEDDYNNLDWNFRNQAFYLTSPNGNMYFHGIQYAPSVPVKQGPCVEAYVDLPNMAIGMSTLTTSTLTFTSGAVTNNFVNGGAYNGGFFKSNPFNFGWDNSLSIGTQANTGSIITNANELYIMNAFGMYVECTSLTDTFICNPSLISGAPANYDPMKYCTNMACTFYNCFNFNQPVTIPNGVTNMMGTFLGCNSFNQPVTIPNSVTNMVETFMGCYRFNQPVTISNSVTNMVETFMGCYRFNQPVTIPNSVTNMVETFMGCSPFNQPVTISNSVTNMVETFMGCESFNQPVTIPNSVTNMVETFMGCESFNQPVTISNSVTNMESTFSGCRYFNQPVTIPNSVTNMKHTFYECFELEDSPVPIHISHEIALGDTSNYIYNSLVNGITGISFAPSRILNDA